MSKLFKCSICGREYDNVNDFLKCVTSCAAEVKRKEKEESGQAELRPCGTSRRVYAQYCADVRNPDQESV